MQPDQITPTATWSRIGRMALTLTTAAFVAVGGAISMAQTAAADQPTVVVRNLVQVEALDPLGVSCPGFDILENNTTTRTITDFYDRDGNFLKETQHVSLVGEIVNSTDLSKTLPYYGHWTYFFTNDPNVFSIIGLQFETIIDGHHLAFANGNQFVDFNTGTFGYHGQNNYVFPDVICDPLS